MDLREREKTEVIVRRFRMDAVHGFCPSIACKTGANQACRSGCGRQGRATGRERYGTPHDVADEIWRARRERSECSA